MVTVRGVVFSALFAALLAVFSYTRIDLGFTPVPITLQTLAVMMAGAFLGPGYGFLSILLVVVLTALGLPLMGGNGGLPVILGATGGYIVSWPFSALLIGWFLQKVRAQGLMRYVWTFIVVEAFGSLFVYLIGVPWLAVVGKMTLAKALVGGCFPFLLGDAIKAGITTLVAVPLGKQYPPARLTGRGGSRVVPLDHA
ncbi:biotin transporter BioY [Alicyclobacillus macrosporangiidus]|uniref:Biotin transporter n=1 Tax=Alicyclobacillus macrosporangiidus TaxID=392015 RepID=A0A1I7IHE1_9BACL|nr:biotin transporter BioY [Alicyclobacillus macrosporangiidus]SFU72348.1 biotin transport system substrate-specific component [Alicyclobacillus macrosporangiidus]